MDSGGSRLAYGLLVVVAFGLGGCFDGTTDPTTVGGDPTPQTVSLDSLLTGLGLDSALARISAGDMQSHIDALAHDSMMGRRTGRPEIEMAAAYVAQGLATAAVAPGADDYRLRWDLPIRHATQWADTLALRPANVVGLIPGSDPALASEYVVVTAHYDHVGTGAPDAAGDSIFNGADDNASGTAALLEVADAIAALETPLRRSVLFLAVSGEELGLLGSEAFVASPSVPVSAMVANINLDMVSRGSSGTAFVIGYSLSDLGALAAAAARVYPGRRVTVASDQILNQDLMARSDHFHFARNQVPAVGLFGGLHPDYHTRDDEADRVDTEKAAGIARLATIMVAAVAMMDEPPAWTYQGRTYMQRYW